MKFLFLLVVLFAFPVMAQNITLLTSLKMSDKQAAKVEQIFRQQFEGRGRPVLVKHDATPSDLWYTMNSPHTSMLFWVSHSAAERNLRPGLVAAETISDRHGNDVKRFFTNTTPYLRYLAIIGCQADRIVQSFTKQGYYADRKDLKIFSFDKKIELFKGLKQAINAAPAVVTPEPEVDFFSTLPRNIYELHFQRSPDSPAVDSWIELGDRVVAFLHPDRDQGSGILSHAEFMATQGHLRWIRAQEGPQVETLGSIDFQINGHHLWKRFDNTYGAAIGDPDRQLYLYRPTP